VLTWQKVTHAALAGTERDFMNTLLGPPVRAGVGIIRGDIFWRMR
jgi:hypothetical protein